MARASPDSPQKKNSFGSWEKLGFSHTCTPLHCELLRGCEAVREVILYWEKRAYGGLYSKGQKAREILQPPFTATMVGTANKVEERIYSLKWF